VHDRTAWEEEPIDAPALVSETDGGGAD
jgi:hypothetical protein